MKWFLAAFSVALVLSGSARAQDTAELSKKVAGLWKKDGKKQVTLNPDGTMSDDSGVNGTWKWLSEQDRKINIDEGKGGLIYNVMLDATWNSGAGKVTGNRQNDRNVGMGVKFVRLASEPDALTKLLLQTWKSRGDTITFNLDGTYKGINGTRGTWTWADREKRIFQMTGLRGMLSFTMTLAADGNTATGKVSAGDPNKVGNVVDYVRVEAPTPPPQTATIPTLGGPPITKPSGPPPAAEPAKTPPVASTPPAPEPKELSVTGKWLAEQDVQWQATFDRDVNEDFIRGRDELKKQYLAAVEAQLAQSSREGKLDEAVEARAERDRVAAGGEILENGDAATSPALKGLRASFSRKWTALVDQRTAKARGLFDRYDGILNQFQVRLTQNQRLDEALEIKSKREQISAAWLKEPAPGVGKGK